MAGPLTSEGLDRRDMRVQLLWYLLVGGLSFLADLGIFAALVIMGVPAMLALVVAFALGTLVNYQLSRLLAFTGGRFRPTGEIMRIVVISLGGLGLTALLLAAMMAFGMSAVVARVIATPFAFGWNYFGRRLFVFHAEMPDGVWRLSARAAEAARLWGTRDGRGGI
jgi:putative flippase GtrA